MAIVGASINPLTGRPRLPVFGGLVAGAFATWSTTDKSANLTLSNANLTSTTATTTDSLGRATCTLTGATTYKWEVVFSAVDNRTRAGFSLAGVSTAGVLGATANTVGYIADTGSIQVGGAELGLADPVAPGTVVSFQLTPSTGALRVQPNGGAATTVNIGAGSWLPAVSLRVAAFSATANFGASAWAIAPVGGAVGCPPL